MLRDIKFPVGYDVALGIVPEKKGLPTEWWRVHLINLNREEKLEWILVSIRAEGTINAQPKRTGTLRYCIERLQPATYVQLDTITPPVKMLENEYFITYWKDNILYERKLVIPAGFLCCDMMVGSIPVMECSGIFVG